MAQSRKNNEIGQITNEKATTTIEWKIHKYFALSHKIGKDYFSPSFNFLDAEWYLQLLPNGQKGSADWIGLYLWKEQSVTEIYDVNFTLGIRKCDGSIYHSWSTEYDFQENDEGYGTNTLVQKDSILKNIQEIAPDRNLAIFCVLKAKDHARDSSSSDSEDEDESDELHDERNEKYRSPPLRHPRKEDETYRQKESLPDGEDNVLKDMKDLLVSERLCDVKILIKGKELQAHKVILAARSSVFSAMFEHEMKEKKSNIVEILDFEFNVFKEFLHYLYTGKVQEVSEINVCEVYVLADKYDVQQLKKDCLAMMNRTISVDNFCDIVSLAVKFNESELLKKATDYFLKNTKNILQNVKWLSFMAENITVANELFLKTVT